MEKINGFILNKPFQGSYTNEEGKIAHEIIDFFLTDKGERYAYNNPYGQFSNKENYDYQYMFLCSSAKINKYIDEKNKEKAESIFKLKYLLKIEKILHNFGVGNNDSSDMSFIENQKRIKKIIDDNDISYGDKKLYDIYGFNDNSLYVTFKISEMYEPKNGVIEITTPGYIFQRNKGYVNEKDHKDAYNALKAKIDDKSLWKKCTLRKVDINEHEHATNQKTFLDFILKNDSEECFTNMLYFMLSYNDVFNNFVNKFNKNDIPFNKEAKYDVKREVKIEKLIDNKGGRTDICAQENSNEKGQRIVIENKVFSGLNGLNSDDNTTQLSTYYNNWANKNPNPICFIICPDFRVDEIKNEIEESMKNVYQFVTYSEISKFLENQKFGKDFVFKSYVKDAINAFKKYGYKNKIDLFEQLFLEAIK